MGDELVIVQQVGGFQFFSQNLQQNAIFQKPLVQQNAEIQFFNSKTAINAIISNFYHRKPYSETIKKTKNNFLPNFPIFYLKTCLFVPIFLGEKYITS